MAENRITTDTGTDLTLTTEVIEQDAEANTTTLRWDLRGRVVMAPVAPKGARAVSDLDLGALKALAEKATPGPWVTTTQGGIESAHYRGPGEDPNSVAQTRTPEDWEFIAAANPVTVLALIERVQAAEAVIAEVKRLADETDVETFEATQGWLVENIRAALSRYENGATDE